MIQPSLKGLKQDPEAIKDPKESMVAKPESTGDKSHTIWAGWFSGQLRMQSYVSWYIMPSLFLPSIFIFVNHATNHNWIWAHLNFSLTLYVELSTYSGETFLSNFTHPSSSPCPLNCMKRTHNRRNAELRIRNPQALLQSCYEWARRLRKTRAQPLCDSSSLFVK